VEIGLVLPQSGPASSPSFIRDFAQAAEESPRCLLGRSIDLRRRRRVAARGSGRHGHALGPARRPERGACFTPSHVVMCDRFVRRVPGRLLRLLADGSAPPAGPTPDSDPDRRAFRRRIESRGPDLIGLDPDELTYQGYMINFLRQGGIGAN